MLVCSNNYPYGNLWKLYLLSQCIGVIENYDEVEVVDDDNCDMGDDDDIYEEW